MISRTVPKRVSFASSPEGPEIKSLACCKCLVQNEEHEIRLCPRLDRRPIPCPATRGLEESRVQNRFQRRWFIRSDDKAPCSAPLFKETGTRRHAHRLEARPAGPQPGRPDTDARRLQKTRREIPLRACGHAPIVAMQGSLARFHVCMQA